MGEEELQKIVEETRELSKDNNRILHSIQRREKVALIAKIAYWVILLGIALGAFYYIQPYVDKAKRAYDGIVDTQHKMAEIPKSFSLDTIKSYFK